MAKLASKAIEVILGGLATDDFLELEALASNSPDVGFSLQTQFGTWDVRATFDTAQILTANAIVRDVLPKGALAIAEDWGGNLFCVMLDGPTAGQVIWWNHERSGANASTTLAADCLQDFIHGLSSREA